MARKRLEQAFSVQRNRNRWCIHFVGRDGKSCRHVLGIDDATGKTQAEQAAATWWRKRGAAIGADQTITVGEIVRRYIENRRVAGKKAAQPQGNGKSIMQLNWQHLEPHFARLQPADLAAPFVVDGEQRTRCHAYAKERQKQGARRNTIWTELQRLRAAMNWASREAKLIATPPHVWVPKAGKSRDVSLSSAQVQAVLDACVEPHMRLIFLIAACTGARKSAILELRWEQVDLQNATIDFRREAIARDEADDDILDSSHIKGRGYVDIAPLLLIALAEQKELAESPFVIEWRGRRVQDCKKGVRVVLARAGLLARGVGLHAFRHTLATIAAGQGIDMRQIQKMLGHDDIRTTERIYAKHQRGYTAAVAAIGQQQLIRHSTGEQDA